MGTRTNSHPNHSKICATDSISRRQTQASQRRSKKLRHPQRRKTTSAERNSFTEKEGRRRKRDWHRMQIMICKCTVTHCAASAALYATHVSSPNLVKKPFA
eukprot:7266462-Pyramimonas_sp.AAC.1